MNEEELTNLWKADQTAPTIDFAALQKSLNIWHDKLRRKVKIEIVIQSAATAISLIPALFLPKMMFASLFAVILGVWYVRELRGLYKEENTPNYLDIKHSLNVKILAFKQFIRRTRFVMYVFSPLIIPALFYGLNIFNNPLITTTELVRSLLIFFIIYETLTFIATEIYFKVLYTPALNELKNLLRQLESDE